MEKEFSYLKEKRRMLDSIGRTGGACNGVICSKCPVGEVRLKQSKHYLSCHEYELDNPEEAEAIIRKWSEEHPIITNADKFKEVFGAEVHCYGNNCIGFQCFDDPCNKCENEDFWNKEYKEPEKEK